MTAIEGLFECVREGAACVIEGVTRLVDDELFPEERAHVRNAVAKRRAEFGTARQFARQALGTLGVPAGALVPEADRAPIWPAGVVGSITHTDQYCAVVVARSPPWRAVGLDVETVRPLDDGVLGAILVPAERAWLDAQPPAARDALAVVFFSAKEAFYKCQYPVTRRFLDFHEVEIRLSGDDRFEAHLLAAPDPRFPSHALGRRAMEGGRVLCAVELRLT
jgi:4'-phosphopantetheinyl transferase EntD